MSAPAPRPGLARPRWDPGEDGLTDSCGAQSRCTLVPLRPTTTIGLPFTEIAGGVRRICYLCFEKYVLHPCRFRFAPADAEDVKCETYEVEPGKDSHGYSGPLKVSWGGFYTEVGQEFLEVGAGYDKIRGATDDLNGLFECNKYGVSDPSFNAPTAINTDFHKEVAEVSPISTQRSYDHLHMDVTGT